MTDPKEQLDRAQNLAAEIWNLARSTLLVHMRFLDAALFRLKLTCGETDTVQTDGQQLWYSLKWVLNQYRQGKDRISRAYLHMLLHCIYRHMYVAPGIEPELWDIACDIAVENNIRDLEVPGICDAADSSQTAMLEKMKEQVKPFTAEKLYRFLTRVRPSPAERGMLRKLFQVDDHTIWYLPSKGAGGNAEGDGGAGKDFFGEASLSRSEMEGLWQEISHRVQINLETMLQGKIPGSMTQELKAVNREKYDYSEFLRRFMTLGEVMQVNHEEFDYVYYTYGLKLYENLPLIEPLEYKEVKRIKEFVIAIDTSGSTSGPLVQRFLNKTYNILKQQENFFTKINLHIIQCDADIQEDAKITCQEEFDAYLADMKIRGLGGTDFRPVFRYVEKLQKEKEFTNLRGLIYFTDGFGSFPDRQPPYDTAFVFVDDNYNNYDVPVWAIKLILQPDEI